MNKKHLIGLIGLALGFIAGFFLTSNLNKDAGPAVVGQQAGAPGGQNMMANVQETLQKAKDNPADATAQIEAARMYYQVGQIDEAINYLKKAYDIDSGNLGVTATIGNLYFDKREYVEAETWYRRAAEIDSSDGGLFVEIGATYLQREPPDPDKAIVELNRALQINASDSHALGHVIEAYALKKDIQAAETSLTRFRQADPTSQKLSVYEAMVADLKAGRPVTIPKE